MDVTACTPPAREGAGSSRPSPAPAVLTGSRCADAAAGSADTACCDSGCSCCLEGGAVRSQGSWPCHRYSSVQPRLSRSSLHQAASHTSLCLKLHHDVPGIPGLIHVQLLQQLPQSAAGLGTMHATCCLSASWPVPAMALWVPSLAVSKAVISIGSAGPHLGLCWHRYCSA